MSTRFRLRYEERGGHTHVRVFAGPISEKGYALSLGLCGNLVFRNDEWLDFRDKLFREGVEIMEESE